MKRRIIPFRSLLLAAFPLVVPCHGEIILGWETTGQSAWGTQGLSATSPSYADPDVTVGGLTRGAGFATTNTAVANAWGGHGIEGPLTPADAVLAGNVVTFTITPKATFELSATSLDLNYRRSSTGPTDLAIQYQVGAGAFTEVATYSLSSISTAGATISGIDLSDIPALQDVVAQTITFRLVPYGATDPSGVFYVFGPLPGFDLRLNGSVQTIGTTGDPEPPLIASLFPADESTDATADGAAVPTLLFNENIALGTGLIKVKNFTTGAEVASIDVTNFDQVDLVDNQLGLKLPALLQPGVSYYIEVPPTAIRDLAIPPNSFPGITGTVGDAAATRWNFTIATAGAPPTVVVNEYVNGSPDRVELLVIGDGIAGGVLDMRGMILKDFSSNMGSDGGRGFQFADVPLWAMVPVGTLIVASNAATSPDVSAADYTLSVGLTDATYFTPGTGTFDIAGTEMVMIKAAGSGFAGTTGGIHALAGGVAGTQFATFQGAKLRSTGTSPTNAGVFANNAPTGLQTPLETYSDTSGNGATGSTPAGQLTLGAPNTGTNASYIAALRGLVPGDGDGIAFTTNLTAGSPYDGLPVFDDDAANQSVKLTLKAFIPGATISNATITVPASLGTPTAASLSGPGGSGSVSVAGQVVTVSGAAATTANALEVTIQGLTTPVPTASNYGAYPLAVATSAAGGTLLPIATPPVVRVVVPVSLVRNQDPVTRASLNIGVTVAVDGTVSEADFGGGTANFSGFLQDATGGINIFSPSLNLGLVRPNRFVVIGSVAQFNGLTEIIPSTQADIVNLGPATEPVPQVVTLATLLADPESYEGELIKVENLTYVSGTWGPASTVVMRNSTPTNIDVRIQAGSGELVEGVLVPIANPGFPVITVTGVFGQFDGSSPFTTGYQIMPRQQSDLTGGIASDFDIWAGATGATGGMTGDTDFDGRTNEFEYAFGLNPVSGGSVDPFVAPFSPATGKFTYSRRKPALTKLGYRYEYSTTLGAVWGTFASAVPEVSNNGDPVETITVEVPAALLDEPRLFIRVAAE
jgi:hypothetical protein